MGVIIATVLHHCMINLICRSTPVECLHAIKYLLADLMNQLSPRAKEEISAWIADFLFSALPSRLSTSICRYTCSGINLFPIIEVILQCYRYYGSFQGRDYKLLAQIAPFRLWDYLDPLQKDVWLTLSKVIPVAKETYL